MGSVEGAEDSIVVENEGGKWLTESNFVDDGKSPTILHPKYSNSITTGPQCGPATEEKIGRKLFLDTVKAEQREKFIRSLVEVEVGTNRVESN